MLRVGMTMPTVPVTFSSESSMNRCYMLYALVYHTLSGAARNMLGGVVCQNKARSTRLRFRTLPMHPTSQLKRPGGVATVLWASAVSHPHTVLSRLSEPSGGGLVRGCRVEMVLPPSRDLSARHIRSLC